MNKQIKAELLSALVYPGAGHFIFKQYIVCAALVTAFSLPLYLVFGEIMDKANLIVERIQSGEIPLDVSAISAAVSNITSGPDAQDLNVKIYFMIFVWVIGIIDIYRIGKVKTEISN